MAIDEINNKEQKKAEKETEKEEKKEEKYKWLSELFTWVIWCTIAIAIICGGLSVRELRLWVIIGIVFIISICFKMPFWLLRLKEIVNVDEKEFERKESLIDKLNKDEFKEIKLEETGDVFFNAFLNNTIKAKIHPDNDEIVIVEFYFIDNLGLSYSKSVPFSIEDLFESIDDVIENDNN